MSSENHGVPEDDDPFAYLYRGEGADGAAVQETAPLPGVPRTSYHQATQVGRTQYGQQAQQQAPQGYQPQPKLPHQEQPTAQYSAPPQYGPQQSQQQHGAPAGPTGGRAAVRGGSDGSGGNNRGVMIGSVAVVVVVAIGIGIAMFNSGPDKSGSAASGSSAPAAVGPAPSGTSQSATPSAEPSTGTVDPVDASSMAKAGGAKTNNNHKGALSAGGNFVDGMNAQGASVTWTVNAPAKGGYLLWVRYANATGQPSSAGVTVNQKPSASGTVTLRDYGSKGSWDAWFSSYGNVSLNKGQNTITLTCVNPAACNFNLDQLALTPPDRGSESRPAAWKK